MKVAKLGHELDFAGNRSRKNIFLQIEIYQILELSEFRGNASVKLVASQIERHQVFKRRHFTGNGSSNVIVRHVELNHRCIVVVVRLLLALVQTRCALDAPPVANALFRHPVFGVSPSGVFAGLHVRVVVFRCNIGGEEKGGECVTLENHVVVCFHAGHVSFGDPAKGKVGCGPSRVNVCLIGESSVDNGFADKLVAIALFNRIWSVWSTWTFAWSTAGRLSFSFRSFFGSGSFSTSFSLGRIVSKSISDTFVGKKRNHSKKKECKEQCSLVSANGFTTTSNSSAHIANKLRESCASHSDVSDTARHKILKVGRLAIILATSHLQIRIFHVTIGLVAIHVNRITVGSNVAAQILLLGLSSGSRENRRQLADNSSHGLHKTSSRLGTTRRRSVAECNVPETKSIALLKEFSFSVHWLLCRRIVLDKRFTSRSNKHAARNGIIFLVLVPQEATGRFNGTLGRSMRARATSIFGFTSSGFSACWLWCNVCSGRLIGLDRVRASSDGLSIVASQSVAARTSGCSSFHGF
mmetsp:Transcript_12264/g.18671  ORF Transcript_12264/g.18671 Transcript_12264/m.18671 type:complete len:525 (-) Transcript_12264:187-1761(-)